MEKIAVEDQVQLSFEEHLKRSLNPIIRIIMAITKGIPRCHVKLNNNDYTMMILKEFLL